jgi:hypothetical protein
MAACKFAVPDSIPAIVPCRPENHCESDQCHRNAQRMVDCHGGSVQLGWSIRVTEWVAVWLELHSVWLHPSQRLLCTTPPPYDDQDMIAFLPDPSPMGIHPPDWPSIYHPWDDSRDCLECVELLRAIDRLYFRKGEPFHRKPHPRTDRDRRLKARLGMIATRHRKRMKSNEQGEPRNPH